MHSFAHEVLLLITAYREMEEFMNKYPTPTTQDPTGTPGKRRVARSDGLLTIRTTAHDALSRPATSLLPTTTSASTRYNPYRPALRSHRKAATITSGRVLPTCLVTVASNLLAAGWTLRVISEELYVFAPGSLRPVSNKSFAYQVFLADQLSGLHQYLSGSDY